MRIRLVLLSLLCLPLTTQAAVLQAEARAANKDEAQRQALSDLANSIFVNIQSESLSHVEGSGKRHDEMNIKSSSDIPLIGAEIKCDSIGGDVLCKVSLDSGKSLGLYSQKLNELSAEISTLDARIAKATGNERYELLTQTLTVLEQYEKYRAVAQMLGATQIATPTRTRSDTDAQLRELEKTAPSIELATKVLLKGVKAEAVYIYPAVSHGSHEVTPFARVLRDRLAQSMTSVDSPEKAQTFFKGEYELLDNGIHLTYRLLDTSGNTLETRVAMLAPAAYKGLQAKPSSIDFDKLLHDGVVESGDFRVQLSTRRGSEALSFEENEEIELLVKFNHPGYFYVVGHVVKKSENYSYLVELESADSDRRFVRKVNADDVNQWLSIGKFEATAPFGVESIQLLASKDDPVSRLPSHQLDSKTELDVIATNAKEGIIKTRALKRKEDAAYQAETVLMFTTLAKNGK